MYAKSFSACFFEQSAMMSVAFKEGLKIPAPALNDVIAAANQDIRQVGVHRTYTPAYHIL